MASSVGLALTIHRHDPTPLPTQIAFQVRSLITRGALDRGEKVPATRALAAELSVSRGVTEAAYEQLIAEGWLVGRRGSGTFVTATGDHVSVQRRPRSPRRAAAAPTVSLDTGTPWIDPQHAALWRRAWREMSAQTPPTAYPPSRGLLALRELVRDDLVARRGIACDTEHVMISTGTTDGLRQVLAALPPGSVAVEDPGYRAAVATIRASGRAVHDVPVDSEGANLAATRIPDDLRALYVTPAHQHPTGVTMSASRRMELLRLSQARGILLIEDDYDSQFRYDVAPLPALASLDRDAVVHLGTTSKSVMPGLRLGWIAANASLMAGVAQHRQATHDLTPWPVQRAYLAMMRDGYADQLVRAARRIYAARERWITKALEPYGQIARPVAGMYLTLRMDHERASRAHRRCAQRGVHVPLLADYGRTHRLNGLVVGFGGTPERALREAVATLVAALSEPKARG
ncbi:MAG: PLP-dependent aminotransferase family protein [Ornithinimicrobium sp.]